jgi:hypothetical protein
MEVFPDDGVQTGYNFYHEFFSGEPRAVNGYVEHSTDSGLGLELSIEVIKSHLVSRTILGNVSRDLLSDTQEHFDAEQKLTGGPKHER